MKFAFFLGCNIPARVQHYEMSARAILERLNIDLVDIREFNCCGYPMRNNDFKTFVLFSARNLALAESRGLDMITLCKCCYGSLKKADHLMKEDPSIRDEVNSILSNEGLEYKGSIQVKHLLTVLHKDVGIKAIKEKITGSYKDLNIATHYGCHALRPSDITQFDDPIAPVLFDQLVEATGAKSIEWSSKLDCCGAPALGVNDKLSMELTKKKLANGRQSGAHFLCVACPYCQLQFDSVQSLLTSNYGCDQALPSLVFPQLLGLAMGIEEDALGMGMNQIDVARIRAFLS